MSDSRKPTLASRVLICAPNWLGDSIMAMPGVQAFRAATHATRISVLVKSPLAPLWRMHAAALDIIELRTNPLGTALTAREVADQGFAVAYVLPNSFRSALIPAMARVPRRIGHRGHRPARLLTDVVPVPAGTAHQSHEYVQLFGVSVNGSGMPTPELRISADVLEPLRSRFLPADNTPLVAVMPGAAYGPSKRWPAIRFAEVARELADGRGCRVLVLGSKREAKTCAAVAAAVGPRGVSLAGYTSLPELAALLKMSDVVLCNDSGGMHLAAAMDTRVVAIFGITDPRVTGPLGAGHQIIQAPNVDCARDLARRSQRSEDALAAIAVSRVLAAAETVLDSRAAP